jgi:hypothetical protein
VWHFNGGSVVSSFDVEILYENGSERISVSAVDAAEAIIAALTQVRRKQRLRGNYRAVLTVNAYKLS